MIADVARRAVLAATLVCALSIGGSPLLAQTPPQGQAGDALVDHVVQSLTPREKIGQLFMVGFVGPEVSPGLRQFINQHKVGAVFLNRESCNIINGSVHDPKQCGFPDERNPDTPGQIAALAQQLQDASCAATTDVAASVEYCLPIFVAVDHEGDDRPLNRIVNRFTPIPANMAIGATFDPSKANTVGCIVGKELAAVGVNMLLGPDLDILESPRSGGPGDQGIRTFGGSSLWVAELGASYVRGVQECGAGAIATVGKHFPGHGRSTRGVDYEDIPVVVGKTLEELGATDLFPFAAVAQGMPGEAGVTDAIMNSHLSYPEVKGCDDRAPVTFSSTCMQTFFSLPAFAPWRAAGGLTVADDLASGAAQAYAKEKFGTYAQNEIATEGLMAGNDLIPLIREWQWQALGATIDFLAGRYESDPAVRARIDDAARRVLLLKARLYGGLEPAVITRPAQYQGIVGQSESADQVAAISAGALTFVQPAGRDAFLQTLPAPTADQRILFVECWDDPTCAPPNPIDSSNYRPLWPRGKLAGLAEELFPDRVSTDNLDTISFSQLGALLKGGGDGEVRRAVESADWIVFGLLERDSTGFPDSEVLKDFLGRGPTVFDLRDTKIVVFAYNAPYHFDAGELGNVDLFVALYTKIEPALRASLRALFQDTGLLQGAGGQGSLPVDYVFGDYVLYDLDRQVSAEPSQAIQLSISPERPAAGEEISVRIEQPLIARNGHRVPNGTSVTFAFALPDGAIEEVAASTAGGLASAAFLPPGSGDITLTIKSGDLEWSPAEPISIGGDAGGLPVVMLVAVVAVILLALAGGAFLLHRRGWLPWWPARPVPLPGAGGPPGGLVTILFTDVEGSTALTDRLGDQRAQELLRAHNAIVRDALRAHGGAEVKTMGDGFMASFSSATRALECAIAMQRAFADRNPAAGEPVRIRCGLNAGEPIAEDEDFFGTAVITAARVAAQAQGGEILASDVVRQLVAGKGFLFSDRGDVVLRGFEDPVRLFELRWREDT